MPLGWLLSYAAFLVFFLGLFFFALFGLLIGAAVYRVAAPMKPYSRSLVLTGTTLLVALTWGLSIFNEAREFPSDYADRVVEDRFIDLGGATKDEYRAIVRQDVRKWLAANYAPGGVLGYLRWVVTNGEFVDGDIASARKPWSAPHRRRLWAVRCLLSVGLLAFGIGSQTFGLREPRRRATPARDDDKT